MGRFFNDALEDENHLNLTHSSSNHKSVQTSRKVRRKELSMAISKQQSSNYLAPHSNHALPGKWRDPFKQILQDEKLK